LKYSSNDFCKILEFNLLKETVTFANIYTATNSFISVADICKILNDFRVKFYASS
jgi:hypothetical protein